MAVTTPTTATTVGATLDASKMAWARTTRYTPAVTMVAAWIRADTGVGPAMASGSHTYSGTWADFPITPENRRKAPAVSSAVLIWPAPAIWLIVGMLEVPAAMVSTKM